MGDLTSYSFSDFILFSQTAYFRQFELYNQAIWPLHLVAILFSCLIIYALLKKSIWAGRFTAVLLSVCWIWVAWAFLYERFYQIHVVANWYALGFILQAVAIFWFGVVKKQFITFSIMTLRIKIGVGLLLIALIFYPFIAFLTGRNWLQFEMFGLTPDPTVLATLAILLIYKSPRALYIIPTIWLIISSMTLIVM